MDIFHFSIGEHLYCIHTDSSRIVKWMRESFQERAPDNSDREELVIQVEDGYGEAFKDFEVRVQAIGDSPNYQRSDYNLTCDWKRKEVNLKVHDHFALKHALLNLCSAYMIQQQWGILIRASSMVEQEKVYVFIDLTKSSLQYGTRFAGGLLIQADEVALLRIGKEGIHGFDSPFRSDMKSQFDSNSYPLGGIYLLHPSYQPYRQRLKKSDSLAHLLTHAFYWAYSPSETELLLQMGKKMVEEFQLTQLHLNENRNFLGENPMNIYFQCPDVKSVEVEREWILFHMRNQTVTKLNETAGYLWKFLRDESTLEQLAERMVELARERGDPFHSAIDRVIGRYLENLTDIGVVECRSQA